MAVDVSEGHILLISMFGLRFSVINSVLITLICIDSIFGFSQCFPIYINIWFIPDKNTIMSLLT